MLERGESLPAVADALGNTLAVTQRHYNPWTKIRQSKLDEAVRGGRENDPLLRTLDDQEAAAKLAARQPRAWYELVTKKEGKSGTC